VNATLEQHVPRVFGFAVRLTGSRHAAEDLTQETFLRAWRHGVGTRDADRTRVWLFQIAANLWRDQLRRKRLAPERAGPLDFEQPDSRTCPRIFAEQQEQVTLAMASLDELPARQREVLYLSACEGLAHTEIAEILECTLDAVKSNLSIARRKMRAQLAETLPSETTARKPARSIPAASESSPP
jgi:RNA polymerase sigma-70 factor (ECF subfamily)